MNENVLAAAFRRDEAEALGSVEEFYCSDRHVFSCQIGLRPGTCRSVASGNHQIGSLAVRSLRASMRVRINNSALQVTDAVARDDIGAFRTECKCQGMGGEPG